MDTPLIQSSIGGLIDSFQGILGDNLPIVLAFVAGILVWVILKRWVFSSSRAVGSGWVVTDPKLTYAMESDHDIRNRRWHVGGNEM